MQNDRAAQALMLNSLSAQGTGESIRQTYRKLTTDGQPES
jgi:hypothetical protein